MPFIRLDIFDNVSGIMIPVIISHCCCSSVLLRFFRFLIFLMFFGWCILLWLWTDDPLLELPLRELLSYLSLAPPPAVMPLPMGGVWSSSSSPLFGFPVSEVCSTVSSSSTMLEWDPGLTSAAEHCLVGVLGGSLLSSPLGLLAIGRSSNCLGTTGKRRC